MTLVPNSASPKPRVVILGGGFGGGFAARELSKRGGNFETILIDRHNYLTFYPLMIEAGVGAIEPRHVVIPLRKLIRTCDLRVGEVTRVDIATNTVWYRPVGQTTETSLSYDELVLAMGSVTRPPKVPGFAEYGFEMKTIADAIELRDRGIQFLEMANSEPSAARRRELLTFLVVGGGFTGVELAGEFQAFLHDLLCDYHRVTKDDIRLMLFEHGPQLLPHYDDHLSEWTAKELSRRGVEIRHGESVAVIGEGFAVLSTGERISTHGVYWTAGIAPPPVLDQIPGLPRNERGYVNTNKDLSVVGLSNVWAMGDLAFVPDENGKPYPTTAQVAIRQGPHLARNLIRRRAGQPTKPFSFENMGAFAAIGHRKAAALVKGMRFQGFFGWLLYRGAYFTKFPGFATRLRLLADWTLELMLKSPPVQIGVHRHRKS